MNKTDVEILKRGLRRMGLALLTTAMFAISVLGFFAVATAPGYLAVLMFIGSVFAMMAAITLLYAQGLTTKVRKESVGETK